MEGVGPTDLPDGEGTQDLRRSHGEIVTGQNSPRTYDHCTSVDKRDYVTSLELGKGDYYVKR